METNVIDTKPASETVQAPGFRAHLCDVSLVHLIQLECSVANRRAVRVCSGSRVGYFFFEQGRIFHATTRELEGDAAVLEMLKWEGGTFDPCAAMPWPDESTVTGACTDLIDQATRRAGSNPPPRGPSQSDRTAASTTSPRPGGEAFVRLDADSNVVANRGQTEELAALVAYSAQTARKIGTALRETAFYALEWVTDTEHGVMFVDDDGTLAALKARDERPLARTKSRFNL